MTESIINQYEYFIQKADTVEKVEFEESRIIRTYGEVPKSLSDLITKRKKELSNEQHDNRKQHPGSEYQY
jgi:hypothetical protein